MVIADPRNVDELTRKLRVLLSSPDLRREMGQRARASAERYSWGEVARRTEEIYCQALARQPTRPPLAPLRNAPR